MHPNATTPYAALLLRLALGTLFLAHLLLKLLVFTPAGTAAYFVHLGLPAAAAYLTMGLELLIAIALIGGIYARWLALLGIPLLLGTIVTVHGANGWLFSNTGGGWEFPAFWAVALFVQFLLGDGAYALRKSA